MVKMIIEMPRHIDTEHYVETVMNVIKGRDGCRYYNDIATPRISWIVYPEKVSDLFAKGYSGKNGVNYYEIDAEELDPVIIATLEEVGSWIGFRYNFVSDSDILPREWWRFEEKEEFWKKPSSTTSDELRDEYFSTLSGQKKFA